MCSVRRQDDHHIRPPNWLELGSRRTTLESRQGGSPQESKRLFVLVVITFSTLGLGLEDVLPGAAEQHARHRKVVPTEARRGFELFTILIGALNAYLVVGGFPALALRLVGKHADRDPAEAIDLHGLNRR